MASLPSSPLFRIALSAFLLVIFVAGVAGVWTLLSPHRQAPRSAIHAVRVAHSVPSPKRKVVKIPPAVLKPSEFVLEQAMTFSQRMNRWNLLIVQASRRFNVPQPWIRAVIVAESGGRTMSDENRPLTSRAGALGLMQLMPQTYENMRARYGLGPDPLDPHDNIFAGAALLRLLFLSYGYPAMFSAYNDGPGNLEARLRDGGLLPQETRSYASGITHSLETGIGLHGAKVKFTRPDGTPVWIDSGAIVSVRAALPGEYAPRVHTVIAIGRMRQGVGESLARTKAILHMRGDRG
jgi:hypothetical protein